MPPSAQNGAMMNNQKKLISHTLFSLFPQLHLSLIKPLEGIFKSEISPYQFYSLLEIKNTGSLSMSECADRLGISKQQMTKIINQLAENSLITRKNDKDDRRLVKIVLSDKGEALLARYKNEICRQIEFHLSRTEPEDLTRLYCACTTIETILSSWNQQNNSEKDFD